MKVKYRFKRAKERFRNFKQKLREGLEGRLKKVKSKFRRKEPDYVKIGYRWQDDVYIDTITKRLLDHNDQESHIIIEHNGAPLKINCDTFEKIDDKGYKATTTFVPNYWDFR